MGQGRRIGSGSGLPAGIGRRVALLAALTLTLSPAWGADTDADVWRLTHWIAAPWGPPVGPVPDWAGQTLTLAGERQRGPGPLACERARVEPLQMPHEGLFQGGLPAPADRSAQALGIGVPPVTGWRVSCDSGVFDFHRVDDDTALIGIDNRVWTLSRAPGTRAVPASPAGRVQTLLERHFARGPGTALQDLASRGPWLSQGLLRAFERQASRPRKSDEVPTINGDPFTDAQEYPTRFAVGHAVADARRASVPVRFADAHGRRTLVYRLVHERGQWRLDDIDYGNGDNLRSLFR